MAGNQCVALNTVIFLLFLTDTVNTASRMESNGLPSKIHVSEATANELILFNKGDWLTEREGGVHAKGKKRKTLAVQNTYSLISLYSTTFLCR